MSEGQARMLPSKVTCHSTTADSRFCTAKPPSVAVFCKITVLFTSNKPVLKIAPPVSSGTPIGIPREVDVISFGDTARMSVVTLTTSSCVWVNVRCVGSYSAPFAGLCVHRGHLGYLRCKVGVATSVRMAFHRNSLLTRFFLGWHLI